MDSKFFEMFEKCVSRVYVIDDSSHKVIYASPNVKADMKSDDTCYSTFYGRTTPCPFCPEKLDLEKTFRTDAYISTVRGWYQIDMIAYHQDGLDLRLVVMDETDSMMSLSHEAVRQLSEWGMPYQQESDINLLHSAEYDEMTDVYNKNRYLRDVEKIANTDADVGVLVIDINGLKVINDAYGHLAGDAVISDIADKLKYFQCDSVKCYRIGGDEFAMLQIPCNEEILTEIVFKMNQNVSKFRDTHVSVAIGWAVKKPGESMDTAFCRADKRMYTNKAQMKYNL